MCPVVYGTHENGKKSAHISCPAYSNKEFIPGKKNGDPDHILATSIAKYIKVRRKYAIEAKPRANERDHRFLLIGIMPPSLANPHRLPARIPVIKNIKMLIHEQKHKQCCVLELQSNN